MTITAKELSRKGNDVKVLFGAGADSTDKYVPADQWDADKEAVIVKFAVSLPKSAVPSEVKTVGAVPVTMTDAQIATKLAAIAASKPK